MTQFSTRLNPVEGTGGLVRSRVCERQRALAKEKPAPALLYADVRHLCNYIWWHVGCLPFHVDVATM